MTDVYVDSTVIGGLGDGTSKANAYLTQLAANAAKGVTGDFRYLFNYLHREAHSGSNLVLAYSTVKGSPDELVSIDYTDDSYRAGAEINITSSHALEISGDYLSTGVHHKDGGGGNSSAINLKFCRNDSNNQKLVDCEVHIDSLSSVSYMSTSTADGAKLEFENVGLWTGSANIFIYCNNVFRWIGGSSLSGTGQPTTGFFRGLSKHSDVLIEAVDFTNLGTTWDILRRVVGSINIVFRQCKLAAAWAGSFFESTIWSGDYVEMENCGDQDINYGFHSSHQGGTVDAIATMNAAGTTGIKRNTVAIPIALLMASTSICNRMLDQVRSMWMLKPNLDIAEQTITVEIIHNETTGLTNAEMWIDVLYQATTGQQLNTLISSKITDPMTSSVTIPASLKNWSEGQDERAASTGYTVGQRIKSVLSPNSVFECIAIVGTGTTQADPPPLGFSNAADADVIVDNAGANQVTWKALRRQKMQITLTAAEQGLIKVQAVLASPSKTITIANRPS